MQRALEQVRDLFGAPGSPAGSAGTGSGGHGVLPGWSGSSAQAQQGAAVALDNGRLTLGGADHALDGFTRDLTAATNAGRASADDIIIGARKTTAALAPYTHTLPGRIALVTSLTDHLSAAGNLVTGYTTTLPARQQQLTTIATQYGLSPTQQPPGALPPPHHRRRHHRRAAFAAGSPARYQMAGPFSSFQPPGFSLGGFGGGGAGFDPAGFSNLVGHRGRRRSAGVFLGDGSLGSEAVNLASEKLGLMYKWGGKGGPEDGGRVDCSGLVHWAYKRLGIEIGDNTYAQIGHGFQVPPSAIRPGDAIYCNFGEDGNPGPGHVVMATGYGANSRIIEASHDGAPVAFGSMPRGRIVVKRFVP